MHFNRLKTIQKYDMFNSILAITYFRVTSKAGVEKSNPVQQTYTIHNTIHHWSHHNLSVCIIQHYVLLDYTDGAFIHPSFRFNPLLLPGRKKLKLCTKIMRLQ